MKRRLFLLGLATTGALVATTGAVLAASFSEDVVAQLVKLGFTDITAETTLLGRVRILARRADGTREIVLNPRTGEVLRDTWMPTSGGAATRTVLSDIQDDDDNGGDDGNSGSGSGDDDNSGSGSGGDDGNSGSGSGDDDDNSGSGSGGDREDRQDDRDDRSGRGGGDDDKKDRKDD